MENFAELQKAARALQPIRIPASRPFLFMGVSILSLVVLIGGPLALRSEPIKASLAILILAPFLIAWLIGLRRGATYIELNCKSVTRCLYFQKTTVRWDEVTDIRIDWFGHEPVNISWNREIRIGYCRDGKNDGCWIAPKMFAMNAEELMSLVLPFYERAQGAKELAGMQAATTTKSLLSS